jgi:hypothetical protein
VRATSGVTYTRYFSLQAAKDGRASGLKATIIKAFDEDVQIPYWKEKLVAMGTDGAAVNTGCNTGLVVQMREEVPWLTGIWCVAHKLELALLDAIKEEQFLLDMKDLLKGLYKHYHYSGKAIRELKELAAALEEKVLMPVNILGMRWAPHMYRALKVLLVDDFAVIYMHCDHQAEAATSSLKMVGRARKLRKRFALCSLAARHTGAGQIPQLIIPKR